MQSNKLDLSSNMMKKENLNVWNASCFDNLFHEPGWRLRCALFLYARQIHGKEAKLLAENTNWNWIDAEILGDSNTHVYPMFHSKLSMIDQTTPNEQQTKTRKSQIKAFNKSTLALHHLCILWGCIRHLRRRWVSRSGDCANIQCDLCRPFGRRRTSRSLWSAPRYCCTPLWSICAIGNSTWFGHFLWFWKSAGKIPQHIAQTRWNCVQPSRFRLLPFRSHAALQHWVALMRRIRAQWLFHYFDVSARVVIVAQEVGRASYRFNPLFG